MQHTNAIDTQPYICLGTNQPLPNLTPLVGGHVPSATVHIISPPERQHHSRWLARAMTAAVPDITVHIDQISDAYNLALAQQHFQALAERYPGGCCVNITGGSKLLTLAVWETLRRPQDRIFYVRPNDDTVAWLHPDNRTDPIRDLLTLPLWLAAFGYEPAPDAPPRWPDVNALARSAHLGMRRLRQVAAAYARNDVHHARRLTSKDGHWVEDALAWNLANLFEGDATHKGRVQDVSGPFKVRMIDQPDVVNELDGAVLYNNRLTLFEAKTGAEAESAGAATAIYRLGQLRERLGGWISQGVFVSTRRVSDAIKARATYHRVHVIDVPPIVQLRKAIEAIISKSNVL